MTRLKLYSMEQLVQDLEALVKWKNLTPIQDPGQSVHDSGL